MTSWSALFFWNLSDWWSTEEQGDDYLGHDEKTINKSDSTNKSKAASARRTETRNIVMDRKGGGPVSWNVFYGKIASGYAKLYPYCEVKMYFEDISGLFCNHLRFNLTIRIFIEPDYPVTSPTCIRLTNDTFYLPHL